MMFLKECFVLVTLIGLLMIEFCVGNPLLYRREAESSKDRKEEAADTSQITTLPSEEEGDSTLSVRPRVKAKERQCMQFEHHYCNSQFGYTHSLFPNNKGQMLEEAVSEFNDFSQLLNSGCSDKLGIFLCFTYFPLCIPDVNAVQEILPCKEICEEVHKSECTEYVVNATKGSGWSDHLDCNQDVFKPKDTEQCASGDSNGGRGSINNGNNDNEICEEVNCQTKCTIRKSCGGSTFKNPKNTYKFAAKVFVRSKLENGHNCKHAYSVDVQEQFNLLWHDPITNELVQAPQLENITTLHTAPSNCEECPPLTVGSTYLIAGQYSTSKDGSTTVWELPNSKAQSLASKWEGETGDKYSEKLQEWIDSANDAKREGE